MATPLKISIIGAGSAGFSLGLVKDVCLTPNLAGSLISFMDIDPDRLEMIQKLAARYAREVGSDLRFESTQNRQDSIRDADFVINTAYIKGHYHARAMREIVEKYGYFYGGVSTGNAETFQFMLDVCADISRLSPKAWLIQTQNPVFAGTTLMTRETDVKVVGLCHGHYGVYEIARTLGLTDMQDITWQAPGLNHNIWLTDFYYKGENAYPLLDEWIATEAENYWRSHVAERTHDTQMSRGTIHQYHMFGLMPIGDTPRRGGWWYHTDMETKLHWWGQPWGGPDTPVARVAYVEGHEKHLADMRRIASDPQASLVEHFGGTKTREQHTMIIDGLANNVEQQVQVNVPNQGALAGIPDNVAVEVPAIVNVKGIQPLRVKPLPQKIMLEQILPEWLEMERSLLAFKTRDRSILLYGVLQNHQTRSYQEAFSALEEVLNAPGNEDANRFWKYPRPL